MRLSMLFVTSLMVVLLTLLHMSPVEGQGTCACFARLQRARVTDNECDAGFVPSMRPWVGNCHCKCCNDLKQCGKNTIR